MTMRSDLLVALRNAVEGWSVTQPRLDDLLRGRIGNFSLDALINLARQAGLTVRLEIDAAA